MKLYKMTGDKKFLLSCIIKWLEDVREEKNDEIIIRNRHTINGTHMLYNIYHLIDFLKSDILTESTYDEGVRRILISLREDYINEYLSNNP